MKKIFNFLGLFIFAFAGSLNFSSKTMAEGELNYSYTLPTQKTEWISETIQTKEEFDFIALKTNTFQEHFPLEIKIKKEGKMIWYSPDLHDEYGEGVEAMIATEPTTTIELRYLGPALKQPVKIDLVLFPVQKNQGLIESENKSIALSDVGEMGGNEAIPKIISRSAWGADESLRFQNQGAEEEGADPCAELKAQYPDDFGISYEAEYPSEAETPYWPETYSKKVKILAVHHTSTEAIGPQPAAKIRDIYRYHTITRGWGDIGYNYLIDAQGNIYEGRAGGEHNGMPVVAAHSLCSNQNSIGVALIGDYQNNPVPGPTLESLSNLLAYFSDKYELDPLGKTQWHGKTVPVIVGHKDIRSTACPGNYMYNLLPNIREVTNLKLKSNYKPINFDPKNLPYNAEALLKEHAFSLNPQDSQIVKVEFKNIGTQPWGRQTWLYGVANDQQIAESLVPDKPYVMANMDQQNIAPGEIASFQLKLKAPFKAGENVMYVVPVVDNKAKLSLAPMTIKLKVTEPILNYEVLKQDLPTGEVKEGQTLVNEKGDFYSVFLKNTGNVTWERNNTTLNASSPKERISSFTNSPIMAYLSQAQVPPGEVGEFRFEKLTVPSKMVGKVLEQFIPVIQDPQKLLHWFPDQAMGFAIEVKKNNLSSVLSANLLQSLPNRPSAEKPFRVKLSYTPHAQQKTVVKSDQPFYAQNIKGGPYLKLPAGSKVTLETLKNNIYFTTEANERFLVSGLRLIPSPEGIMEIVSWEHRPSWNPALNDNQFRGTLEFRIDPENKTLTTINELPLESYLKGIAEVSNNDPAEKQKLLAVLARSYATFYMDSANRKFPNKPYDGSDDPNVFQKYLGYGLEKRSPNFVNAVNQTVGQVVKYEGKVVKTPYFNESDGRTRSAQEVWGWTHTPYLKSVDDHWCKNGEGKLSGHGVGLSGCGATAMAEAGKNFLEIIQYYYKGVTVGKVE